MLHTLAKALIATGLALAEFAGWIAVGAAFIPDGMEPEIAIACALLIGAGLTAAILALMAHVGWMPLALTFWAAGPLLALAVYRRRIVSWLHALARTYAALFATRWSRVMGIVVLVGYWVLSVAPPREPDSMKYHLAHIRQIIADGRWNAIPDYHYALPFGWSLNYLGFEWLRLPESAQLVNLLLWLIIIAAVVAGVQRWQSRPNRPELVEGTRAFRRGGAVLIVPLVLLATLQPQILNAVVSADADTYAMLAIAATCLLLGGVLDDARLLAVLGFVAWIGVQSRYQLIAAGLAASVLTLGYLVGKRKWRQGLWFLGGAAAAWLLAAPFYWVNYRAFGNPVWPLMAGHFGHGGTYADRMAASFDEWLQGSHTLRTLAGGITGLIRELDIFPVPYLVAAAVAVGAVRHVPSGVRRIAAFIGVFLVIWMIAQPKLYPRFIILLLPAAILVLGSLVITWRRRRLIAASALGLWTAIAGASAVATWYSVDAWAYLTTGDAQAYHRFTWFWPVFQWANQATPPDARFLVVLFSGRTYYLDRPYRRADPWLSGEVDWSAVANGRELAALMDRGRYQYLMYEERNWGDFVGGAQMMRVVADAMNDRVLIPVCRFHVLIAASRVRRSFDSTDVTVLERPFRTPAGGWSDTVSVPEMRATSACPNAGASVQQASAKPPHLFARIRRTSWGRFLVGQARGSWAP